MPESNPRLRTTLDTNILVSALLYPGRTPGQLIQSWIDGAFTLLLSADHEREIQAVLSRPWLGRKYHISEEVRTDLLAGLHLAEHVESATVVPLAARDPDDDIILAEAIGGRAHVLVTGDDDLLALTGDPRLGELEILTAVEFLAVLANMRSAAA